MSAEIRFKSGVQKSAIEPLLANWKDASLRRPLDQVVVTFPEAAGGQSLFGNYHLTGEDGREFCANKGLIESVADTNSGKIIWRSDGPV